MGNPYIQLVPIDTPILILLVSATLCTLLYAVSNLYRGRCDEAEPEAGTIFPTVCRLEESNKDLIASNARKAGAADAYNSMTTYVQELTSNATGIIRGYRLRDTENAKCLDLLPPTDLVNRLRENSLRR